jgi:phosphatidate cytidylyltransferase
MLWSVLLGSLWFFGEHAAVGIITLLSALTLYEFYGMMDKMGLRPFRWMGIFLGVLMTAGPYYLSYYALDSEVLGNLPVGLLVLALLVSCVRVLGERDMTSRIEAVASTVIGLLYIPFMLQFLVSLLTLEMENGSNLVLCLWVVAVSKFCDVGALLTGMAIGRHKMAPNISPKKTWEGAVGGVLISSGIGAAIAYFAADRMPPSMTPAVAAMVAAPLAIIAIISDLLESALKRRAGTKDAGALIPGIGGAFDLTDSLILTAPVAYFIFLVMP